MSIAKYSAICAKVRCMYGKRIKDSDYSLLLSMPNISDLTKQLKSFSSYEQVLSQIDEKQIHRGQLESAVKKQLYDEYEKIYKFLSKQDKAYFKAYLNRLEVDQIINCIRLISVDRTEDFIYMIPHFLLTASSLPFKEMAQVKSYFELCSLLSQTAYYPILCTFAGKDISENLQLIESSIITAYFRQLFFLSETTEKTVRGISSELVGSQIDFINISLIIRLKKYFNATPQDIEKHLLPLHYKIKKADTLALVNCATYEDAIDYLKKTRYQRFFTDNQLDSVDEYLPEYLYKLSKRIIASGECSINVAWAYIHLKSIEVSNLVNIIEGIRYQTDTNKIKSQLVGVNI